MDTDTLNSLVDVPKLLLTILFIIPGFLAEETVREKYPFRRSTTFERTVYSVYYSSLIHFFLSIILVLYFSVSLRHPPWTLQPYVEIMHTARLMPLVFIYCITAIIVGRLLAPYILVRYYEWKDETSFLFPLWYHTLPKDKIAFVRAKLKNGDLYSGQIKYFPLDYDLLSSPEKDIYIVSPKIFRDGLWKKLSDEGVEGILLNTRDIISLELAFKDVKDASG